MKHKQPMPRYYGKNIAQHAQRKFLRRKAAEANQENIMALATQFE